MGKNPSRNGSGYYDPTAYKALQPMMIGESDMDKKAHNLINVLKFIVEWAGFEFIGRIQLKHKRTGKEFK